MSIAQSRLTEVVQRGFPLLGCGPHPAENGLYFPALDIRAEGSWGTPTSFSSELEKLKLCLNWTFNLNANSHGQFTNCLHMLHIVKNGEDIWICIP